ncbi:MAG: hypothetical protein ACOCV1_05100 [Bacillota bacterium]
MKKYIEALIICNNYSDFLEYTLPQSHIIFDHLVIVTSPEDKRTHQLCKSYEKVTCVITENFRKYERDYDKESGMNYGFNFLNLKGWVYNLDADIYLPTRMRNFLEKEKLRKDTIYGFPRRICESKSEFLKNKDIQSYRKTNKISLFPGGYSQLYWAKKNKILNKKEIFKENIEITRETSSPDMIFASLFKYICIFHDMPVLHLGPFGPFNWKGRVTEQ